mgnify:CR=1 FL=1
MILIDNLDQVANQIESERGVEKGLLYAAIELSLASACRKHLKDGSQIKCVLSNTNASVEFYRVKEVVDEVISPFTEIILKDAKKIDKKTALGEEVLVAFEPPDFGRIAATVAKQIITQKIREAEKNSIYDEFKVKENTLINGTVQQVEGDDYLINLGRTEAILRRRDQIPGERFEPNEVIRVLIVNVDKENRRNMISISRTHKGMLKALFEVEIPEINDGIIEVVSVSREPGVRAKVAVKTNNPSIGAVGTCVGQMGGRIQAIIKELSTEKIDVLEWDEDPKVFIANALKPAIVQSVVITNKEEREATVVVASDQLSLAIGKRGVNIRLSVSLTGWRLNVISEADFDKDKKSIAEKIKESMVNDDEEKDSKDKEDAQKSKDSIKEKNIQKTQEKLKEKIKNIEQKDEEMKVSDMADLLNIDVDVLLKRAREKGLDIKDAESVLTVDQVDEIKKKVIF